MSGEGVPTIWGDTYVKGLGVRVYGRSFMESYTSFSKCLELGGSGGFCKCTYTPFNKSP